MEQKNKPASRSRRRFLVKAVVGTSVLLGTGYLGCAPIRRIVATQVDEADLNYNVDLPPQVWFEVRTDNQILFHCPKVEMGQGAFTGLVQLAAEELEVSPDRIEVIHANSATGPIDSFATGGSMSIAGLWHPLRELAATMREMIRSEAARLLKVSPDQIDNDDGILRGGGRSLSYGEIVAQVKEWNVPHNAPPLKQKADWKIIGKPLVRVDLRPKVLGAPIFGFDATLPDMLYASVARPSMVDAQFVTARTEKAAAMPGVVKVVLEEDFVGVIAKSKTEAEQARQALEVEWTVNKAWQQEEIEDMIRVGRGKDFVIQTEGHPKRVLDQEGVILSEYHTPIGAHAQLEPNGAVAFVQEDRAEIIISTQVVQITRNEVAKRLGLDRDKVVIRPTYLGGGFGRRLHTPNAMQAAVLSRAVGRPVHCFFTRQEEFQNDTFRPPTHHLLRARLQADGLIEAIEHNVSSGDVAFGSPMIPGFVPMLVGADFGAWRGGMIQYEKIPNFRAISWRIQLPFATSWWRGLGLLANTFAIESFMDELAILADKDPVQFRLDQITDDERGRRLQGVIRAAAEKSGWGKELLPGRAMGFACSTDANTPVAQVVELSIVKKKDVPTNRFAHTPIVIHKVTCAIDPGLVVNPDGVRAQCEGAIIMGLSACLFEKMEIVDNVIQPTNYGLYPIAMMKHAPKEIDVVLLENGEKPSGVGEPPIGPIGAAIANAVFRLTGQRLRSIPLEL